MNTAALNFHNLGMNNLMMGGAPSHGHTRPVAGVGIASMANPNAPIVSAGGGGNFRVGTPLMLPPGASFGPLTPAQPPLMPYGGARQYGGPVDPRFAYTVGEDGEELFVPDVPGAIVPNRNTPPPPLPRMRSGPLSSRAPNPRSRMGGPLSDRGPSGPQSGPLSERGGPTVVNGGMTAARRMKIAERALAGRGDVVGAAQMAGSRLWAERSMGGTSPHGMPPTPPAQRPVPMGQMPPGPSGKLVPGRSAGSMVWQPNQPVMDVGPDGSVMPPSPRNDVPMPPLPPVEDTRPMGPSPISYDQSPLAPMPLPRDQYNAIAPTAPPGMYGMQPPRVSREDITGPDGGPLGWIGFDNATGKPAGLSGNYPGPQAPLPTGMVPATAERGGITYRMPDTPGDNSGDYQIGSIPGPPVTDPITRKQIPGPSIPVRINKKTGKYTRLTEEQAASDAPVPGPSPIENADQPAWMTWLNEQKK